MGDTRSKMGSLVVKVEYAEDSQWPDAGWLIEVYLFHILHKEHFLFFFYLFFYIQAYEGRYHTKNKTKTNQIKYNVRKISTKFRNI